MPIPTYTPPPIPLPHEGQSEDEFNANMDALLVWYEIREAETKARDKYLDQKAKEIAQSLLASTETEAIDARISEQMTFANLLPHDGSFATKAGLAYNADVSSLFNDHGIVSSYNNSTISNGGTYHNASSTYGGAGPAVNQDIQDLLIACGRVGTEAKYGSTFNILKLTAGAGTASPRVGSDGNTRYRMSNKSIVVAGQFSTHFKARAKNNPIELLITHKNGVKIDPTGDAKYTLITPAEGWVHCSTIATKANGYDEIFDSVRGTDGDELLIAWPSLFNGKVLVLNNYTTAVPSSFTI